MNTHQPRVASRSFGSELANVETRHRFAQLFGRLEHGLSVGEMRGGFYDGASALRRIAGLENPGADEHRFGTKLPHQRGVGRGGDASRRKIRHRQFAELRHFAYQLERRGEIFRPRALIRHRAKW